MMHDELNRLRLKYQSPSIKIIGINHADKKDAATVAFYKRRSSLYDIVFSNQAMKDKLAVSVYPTVLILDGSFKVIEVIEGYSDQNVEKIENYIKNATK
jgi:thioredoxin-related protein